jgi:hypothetical protein
VRRGQQEADVRLVRQLLDGERDPLDDGGGGVPDPAQAAGDELEELARRVVRGGHEQRLGAREVPVHGLPRDAERARHVGQAGVGALDLDDGPRRVEDAPHGLLVVGRRIARPAVGPHRRSLTTPTPGEAPT